MYCLCRHQQPHRRRPQWTKLTILIAAMALSSSSLLPQPLNPLPPATLPLKAIKANNLLSSITPLIFAKLIAPERNAWAEDIIEGLRILESLVEEQPD